MTSIPLHLILLALAGFLTLIFLIMALVGASRSRKTDDPNDDPRCGACGCIIAHPKDGVCPTCRSPLAVVGLVLPFSKRRTPSYTTRHAFYKVTAFPLALWTILISGLGVGGTYAVDQWVLPYLWQTTSTVHARPRFGGCESIILTTLEEYRAHGRAQFDSPAATKTTRIEFKTGTGSHVMDVNLLGPSFSFTDNAGPVTQNRIPGKSDLTAFMQAAGISIDANAQHDAGIIATMLANLAPGETLVISSRDPSLTSKLDTNRISFNGGQWKETIPLRPLAMAISPAIWLLGVIVIIAKQRKRRAQIASDFLKPPLPPIASDPLANADGDAIGGWDITLDANPVQGQRPPGALPAISTGRVYRSTNG